MASTEDGESAGRARSRSPREAALSDSLAQVLGWLPRAFAEEFSEHPLAHLLVREIPATLEPVVAGAGYKIQGSAGRGRWAGTVWVSIFDRLVTVSAQYGYYLVYLFNGDGSSVYLSLNQGTTAVFDEVGGRRYLGVLRDRSRVYAGLLGGDALRGLELGEIDLGGEGRLTRGYQAGNVAAVRYDAGSIPNGDVLTGDVERFIALYRKLVEANDLLGDEERSDDTSRERTDDALPGVEAKKLRWHLRAERNPKLAREAKRCHGNACMVCGFNYAERYGELGDGYIEAHHLSPFSELSGRPTELDPVRDFAVVCASCHRVLHKRRPPYDLDTVRDALR